MKLPYCLKPALMGMLCLLILWPAIQSKALGTDTLATWELTGINTMNWGVSPLPAQNVSSAVTTSGWTRGSGLLFTAAGVATTGTPANNAWGSNGWDAYTTAGANNLDSTIARGDFIAITYTVASGSTVSFASIPAYNVRRSSTGPVLGQWQYCVGVAGTYVNIGAPITWGNTTTAPGNPQSAIDLSTITNLQNLTGGSSVTFRIVNMGATSSGGTWYLNQMATPGRDVTFMGTVGTSGGGPSSTLSLGALSATTFCAIGNANHTLTVSYTSTGTLPSAVNLQLSDANGSFASPMTLGSAAGSSGTFTATLPSGLTAGTGYRVRAISGTVVSPPSSAITVVTAVPEVTSFMAASSNGSVTLSWANPSRCFDQFLVVVDIAPITAQPSGNVFLTSPIYGQGAQIGSGYAVYAALGNSVTVTALTNRTTYHFKVFVQYGNTWSAGVSVQSTPFSIQSFPLSSISTMVGVNSSGALDSLGARARLSGTVYGINQYSSSTTPVGVQYVIMDQTGGIMLRRAGTNFGYSGGTALSEGDSVECLGVLEQYNGLTQLNCDTIIRVATGRTLALPAVVNTLDESTENRLVRLNGLVLVGSNWPTGPITSGVNVDVSNGATIFQMRILPQTDIDGTPAPTGYFDLVGLGLQYDNSSPFTSGYQIAPRSLADFTSIPVVNTTANFARVDTLVSNQTGPIGMNVAIMNPHPVAQTLKVKVNTSPGAVYGVTYETFPVPVNDTITLNVPANASSVPFSVLLYAAVPSGRTDTLGFTMFGASPGISAGIANNSTIRVMSLSVPTYSIGLLRGGNNGGNIAGIPDSNGVYAKATGIVLGGNRRLTPTAGLEFFIFDPGSNAGIGVFRNSNFAAVPYQVTEGDLIRVIGTVSHFNGLGQFNADSIVVISSGNALPAPQVVSAMNENTECRLIRIDNLTLVPSTSTSAQWPVSGATGSGRTPKATNGVDTFDIRIDNDINLFNSPAPTGTFSMIGVGSQYDVSDPRTSGYQLCPRYLPDLLQAVAYSISGTVTYNNSTSTPMTNSLVRIKDGSGTVVASDSTDALGAYVMATVPAGSYTLDAVTSKPWGGVTASDALGISRHFSGSVPLTGLRLSAADVNGSSSITSGDALVVNRRFSGSLAAFSVGDWISERPALNVSANVTQDFKMLAFGDVNGSYVPNSSLRLSGTGMNLMTGSDRVHWDLSSNLIKVTLRADRAMELGAVSLELPLPAGLEVVGMEPGNAKGHSSWGHRDGMWCFGWFDESAMMVNENDAVVIVTLRADRPEILEQLDWTTVRLGAQSELTDVWGQEIQGNLRVPSFKASTTSITMYPNPTTGDLRLVWGGNATSAPSEVMVRDLTGRVVAGYKPAHEALHLNMDLSSVPAGSYTVEVLWNAGNGAGRVERSTLLVRP